MVCIAIYAYPYICAKYITLLFCVGRELPPQSIFFVLRKSSGINSKYFVPRIVVAIPNGFTTLQGIILLVYVSLRFS